MPIRMLLTTSKLQIFLVWCWCWLVFDFAFGKFVTRLSVHSSMDVGQNSENRRGTALGVSDGQCHVKIFGANRPRSSTTNGPKLFSGMSETATRPTPHAAVQPLILHGMRPFLKQQTWIGVLVWKLPNLCPGSFVAQKCNFGEFFWVWCLSRLCRNATISGDGIHGNHFRGYSQHHKDVLFVRGFWRGRTVWALWPPENSGIFTMTENDDNVT